MVSNRYVQQRVSHTLTSNFEPTAANVSGSLRLWNQKAQFTSLVEPKHSYNYWGIEHLAWAELLDKELKIPEGNRQEEEYDHGFTVVDMLDDNGNYFI